MSRTIYNFSLLALCWLFLFSVVSTAHAQFRAGVQGTVSDSSGALVPGANVVLKDTETGKTQEVTTNDEGFYRIPGLAPGKYELTVEKTGYKKSVAQNVAVSAEVIQGIDVILEVGNIEAVVTVSEETAAELQTETA